MKRRIAAILAALLAAFCLGAVGCEKEPTRVGKSGYYCIFSSNGGIEVKVKRNQTERYEVVYDGTGYTFRYEEYTADGNRAGSNGYLGTWSEPGEHMLSSSDSRYHLLFVIKEPEDTRVKPNVKFDPNGAIEYEEGVRYVYEYDDEFHYPLIYGEYNGEKIYPSESSLYDCVVWCENQDGVYSVYPYKIGVYTVEYSIGEWSTPEENEKYLGVWISITVEIVAAAEEEGVV